MTVFVFGNPDLPMDALPIRLLPRLREKFPQTSFERKDPNEEWEVPEQLVVIDTVQGIDRVQTFDDLAAFTPGPRVTLHDFDALMQMQLLQKLGKLKNVTIIGVPPGMAEPQALAAVSSILSNLSTTNSQRP